MYPAGWYPDPGVQGLLRYWDGKQWTAHMAPQQSQPTPAGPVQSLAEQSIPSAASGVAAQAPSKVSIFNAKRRARELENEVVELRTLTERLGLSEVAAIEAERKRLVTEVERLKVEKAELDAQLAHERADLIEVQGQKELQDVGLFRYHHPAASSVMLKDELNRVQAEIKDTVRAKRAISATTNFTFNNSSAKGRKFVSDMSRIMLRAYNAEAENCVKTVKAGNLTVAQARLRKAFDQVRQHGSMIDLHVTNEYHRLRLRELELAADFQMRVQQEKEAERECKAELREQRKAEQELKAERDRLQKELAHYENAIAALEAKGNVEGIERLRETLVDIKRALDEVDYRSANIRAGFVYVISNVGSFGERMVKIGMTRRLEPMDRVRELGDASVPFRFDVHALFFADDAVTVETKLHHALAAKRVNKVNLRREFFYATPEEVLDVLKAEVGEIIEFTKDPVAEEFRLSRGTTDDLM